MNSTRKVLATFDYHYEYKEVKGEMIPLKAGYSVTVGSCTFTAKRWEDALYRANVVYFNQPKLPRSKKVELIFEREPPVVHLDFYRAVPAYPTHHAPCP